MVYIFLTLTLFVILPMAYLLDQKEPLWELLKREWVIDIVMVLALVVIIGGIYLRLEERRLRRRGRNPNSSVHSK